MLFKGENSTDVVCESKVEETTIDRSDDYVIRVTDVSKAYRIWRDPAARLHAALSHIVTKSLPEGMPLRRLANKRIERMYRDFYALRGVSFEIKRGECVGIVGRNGSGKSTLLQVLVGTLQATSGTVSVRGKVAALLELGSGFNPMFIGRENIYLNAAILGLTEAQINERMQSILDFAEIGDFIDQTLNTYSSGMVMRLAFAVQTAIEPDILVVDEALGVSDAFFQVRCVNRIRQLRERGTTILFVSHSSATVKELCDRGILLSDGELVSDDNVGVVLDRYFALNQGGGSIASSNSHQLGDAGPNENIATEITQRSYSMDRILEGQSAFKQWSQSERVGSGDAHIENVQMLSGEGLCELFAFGDDATLRIVVDVKRDLRDALLAFNIRTKQGIDIIHGDSRMTKYGLVALDRGRYILDWKVPINLMHGEYFMRVVLSSPPVDESHSWQFIDVIPYAYRFNVAPKEDGMIGSLVAAETDLTISAVTDAREKKSGSTVID